MLQEASKAINSAFNNSFIKKLSLYLHDCVREEVQSSTFRNLKGDKDNKWIFLKGKEELLSSGDEFVFSRRKRQVSNIWLLVFGW